MHVKITFLFNVVYGFVIVVAVYPHLVAICMFWIFLVSMGYACFVDCLPCPATVSCKTHGSVLCVECKVHGFLVVLAVWSQVVAIRILVLMSLVQVFGATYSAFMACTGLATKLLNRIVVSSHAIESYNQKV